MTYQAIGLGTTVGDGTGDSIRAGGDKINDNFSEIYTLLGTGTALSSGISATATVVTLAAPSITGVASFADGSASAPAIANTGDANTGIFFSAADTVNITTGGTERVEIDSSGLDVTGAITATTTITATAGVAGTTGTFSAAVSGTTGTFSAAVSGTTGTFSSDVTGLTLNATGDTAASDNAAIGYTAAEGLILTGQGSTSDITLKNDADAIVFTVPTGTDDILFPDNAKVMLGAGSDLQIYHDGSNSLIDDTGTGSLFLRSGLITLSGAGGGETMATFTDDGAVALFHNNVVKFATVSGGVSVTGTYTGTGLMTTGGSIVIPNASNIGSVGDTDSIAIASDGVVTFSQAPVFPDGSIPLADLDIDGATDIGAAIVDADLFIIDDGAGGANRKVAASRIATYIGGGVNTPAFSATKSGQTTGQTDNTAVLVTYDTELVDSDGNFASSRFTPTVAGDYFISAALSGGTSSANQTQNVDIFLYKNGAAISRASNGFKVEGEMEIVTAAVSCIITLDTDDYVEVYVKINISAGTARVTNSQFSGFKIIA